MLGFDPPHEQQPVTWWRGYPIHSAALLVIIHVATMLATTLAFAFGLSGVVNGLIFSSNAVWGGAIWQFFTYAFVHPPDGLLWFAIEMYLLWVFGREVERFFGRRDFFRLYITLLLLTPLVLTLYGLVRPSIYFGSGSVHFSMFIAFAALYPGAPMIFNITAKWAAIILVAINSLQALGSNNWPALISLWASIGVAIGFVRWARGEFTLPAINLFKRRPKFHVVRPEPAESAPRRTPKPEDAAVDDIDPLLDKIAKSGINSLTAAERARLEKARAALLKKDPGAR